MPIASGRKRRTAKSTGRRDTTRKTEVKRSSLMYLWKCFFQGPKEYSALVLIECKNYSHPVPVDDVEEFYSKVQRVAAANAKAVIASTAPFQSGTRSFAKSKGIGLMRYFGNENFKWELKRSPSASARSINAALK